MQHTLESHIKSLNELCRCCGSLALTDKQKKNQSYPSLVSKHAYDNLSIFDDIDDKHSKFICYTCVTKLRRAMNKVLGPSNLPDKIKQTQVSFGAAASRNEFSLKIRYVHGHT